MKFKEFFLESKSGVKVYHGSNANFNKLDPKYFMTDTGNVQEGVGMYFGDLKTAEGYGKYLKSVTVNPKDFMESHDYASKLGSRKVQELFKELWKADAEAMFYLVTDYGIYAEEPSDIHAGMFSELYDTMAQTEVRNFQIEIAQNFNAEILTKAWNKVFPKIHGLKNSDFGFFVVINTKYKLEAV